MHYWRSIQHHEVDFILNEKIAIEVKAKESVSHKDLRGILTLKEENLFKKYYVISLEKIPRIHEGIEILPWNQFLDRLWLGDIVEKPKKIIWEELD